MPSLNRLRIAKVSVSLSYRDRFGTAQIVGRIVEIRPTELVVCVGHNCWRTINRDCVQSVDFA